MTQSTPIMDNETTNSIEVLMIRMTMAMPMPIVGSAATNFAMIFQEQAAKSPRVMIEQITSMATLAMENSSSKPD